MKLTAPTLNDCAWYAWGFSMAMLIMTAFSIDPGWHLVALCFVLAFVISFLDGFLKGMWP